MSKKTLPQNVLVSKLDKLSKAYPRIEKVLIVPNRTTGRHILECLTRTGTPWINFRIKTVTSLAKELVEDALVSGGFQVLSPIGAQAVVDSVFNYLAESGKLKYFEKHPVNKGIVEVLTRTLRELSLNGISSGNLKKSCFISSAKENDIRLILSEYEKVLKEKSLVDSARLIMMALGNIKKYDNQERKFLIFSRYYMRGIEREFVEKLCGRDLIVVAEDPVNGLSTPSDTWPTRKTEDQPKCNSDIERLKWLFASKKAPPPFKDGKIEIFNAIGYRNEVREVLRRICADKITVDDAELIYTNSESYVDLIYSLCEKLKIQVTFSEGIGSHMTSAGRTMMGFLLWIKEDFGEIYLRRVFESSGIEWEGWSKVDMLGGTTLGYLLRTSGLGWGRERYSLVLENKIKEANRAATDFRKEGEDEGAAYQETKARNLNILKKICENLLKLIPVKDKDGKIEFGKFCEGCVMFLDKHVKKLGENDVVFIEIAKERLTMLGGLIKGKMIFDEAMEKVINIIAGIRVGASGPKVCHLHVSHYRNGGKSGRGNTFIVGLDEGKFPEKTAQDPVLLDEERVKLASGLELSSERLSKNVYNMAALISGLRGKVTFSYSSYDIKEDRKSFPSSIILQVFRIKEGNPGADYDTMFKSLGEPVGFNESPATDIALDETDWWLNRLVERGVLKDGVEPVQFNYKGIKEGLEAQGKRASDKLTEYDGKITPKGNELDPRQNKEMVMSSSRLEAAAKCPFAYFIQNVLKVRKPDEVEKDVTTWLDALERGSLLHEVFQVFIDKTNTAKKQPSPDEEKELILSILDDVVKKYRDEVPPPSEVVFQNEYTQLKRDVNVFLQINRELGTKVVGTEIRFGDKKDGAVKVFLTDNKQILLRGKIDRIDKAGPSKYHVWDYKTGGTYGYKERGYLAAGRQIQHALYAVIAEEVLKKSGKDKDPKVTKSGYLFPTEKGTRDGAGGIFPRSTSDREKWQEPLGKLLDIIGNGTFIVGKEDACKFCDYSDICGGEKAQKQRASKEKNDINKELNEWKELQDYE